MRSMRMNRLVVLIAVFLLVAAFSVFPEGERETGRIVLATGGTGGVYYPLGGAMASLWSDEIEGVEASSESTGASVENVNLVNELESELGLVQNDISYYAAHAEEMFEDEEPMENLRGVFTMYPETIQIIARADADVDTVGDISDLRVAVGAPGSGTEVNARQILQMHDITYDDIREDFLSFSEAADAIRDGNVDVAFVTAGLPTSSVMDLATSTDITMVGIESDMLDSILDEWSYFAEVTIPADTYSGQDSDVSAVAVMAMMIAHESLDEELVYNITKQTLENTDVLADTHDRGREVAVETALDGMSLDLHPGARRYFEEQDMID
ncbi:MAG: TAXI family TRAP transporter solute-binding subunit [Spirochaetaceae bacterium]